MKLITALATLVEAKTANLIANTQSGKASAERKAETELRDRLNRRSIAEAAYAADRARLEQMRQSRSVLIEMQRNALSRMQHEIDMLTLSVSQSRQELEDAEKALSSFGG